MQVEAMGRRGLRIRDFQAGYIGLDGQVTRSPPLALSNI